MGEFVDDLVPITENWYKRPITPKKDINMPIFEYQCEVCQKEFEKLVFANDTEKVACPECKTARVIKKMSASSFMGTSIGTCAAGPPRQFS